MRDWVSSYALGRNWYAFCAKSDHFYGMMKFRMEFQPSSRFLLFTIWGHLIGWIVKRCEVWLERHYVRENLTSLYQVVCRYWSVHSFTWRYGAKGKMIVFKRCCKVFQTCVFGLCVCVCVSGGSLWAGECKEFCLIACVMCPCPLFLLASVFKCTVPYDSFHF